MSSLHTSLRRWRLAGLATTLALLLNIFAGANLVRATNTPQALPFGQNWANTGLITLSDDWSGVAGIIGYRGDGLVSATAVDPQTVVADGSATPVDVNADQSNPNTFTTGGVSEFEIADPVVALQGSGTADAPHVVIHINTTGRSSIAVAYNLRDIDGSADNAVQPVALQYRVGSSGNFTNIPAGFVADATTGPFLATLVTPVSVVLPSAANNQAEVQLRVITTDALGSDEWVGIDDIAITGTPTGGDNAPAVATTTPAAGASNVAVNANVDLTFSEPVDVAGSWFDISCASSGPHTASVSGGPAAFTLNPDVDFMTGESCTVTVVASQVTDQDTDDPPNTMVADFGWSFSTVAPVADAVIINEVDSDTPSTDTLEFVELYDGGAGNTPLDGLVVVFYNGNGDTSYAAFDLDGFSTDANGYFLLGNSGLSPAPTITFANNFLQNGEDAVALYSANAANFPNGTAVTTGNLVDAIVYDTSDPDDPGLLILLNSGQPQVDENGGGDSASQSNQRCPNGSGGARNTNTYAQNSPTPGALNTCVVDTAPTIVSTTPTNGATGSAPNANIDITFSEPVDVTGSWFGISCANSSAHAATVSGGPTTFTLNPDTDFTANETCTVIITASLVSDQDTDDPPDTMAANFSFSFTTADVLVCGDPATLIHDIQGSGATSPLNGATNITIEGVVVGDYQGAGQLGGYHVQEEDTDADADPATSEGIFVFNTSFPASAGDKVRVKGNVTEFTSSGTTLTELTSISGVTVCSSGNSVTPATVTLPVGHLSDWERYEGMRISIAQDLTVTENFTLGRFGEVSLSINGRLHNPTNVTTPGAAANALQDLNDRSRILLDDGNGQQNIDPTIYPTGGLSAINTLRSGYTINDLSGVLEQRFGVYRVQPVGPIAFDSIANPRGPAPSVGGNLKVAGLNVLNYFTTLDTGSPICGPSGGLDCRGANSAFEFTRQRDKIINGILAINPDIAGLMEVQNDASATIQNLVDGLNAVAGGGTYAYINTGTIGTDAIKVAIIYKPAVVTPVGAHAILDSSVNPLFIDTKNRPSLAQTFARVATGAKFTVVVNHLKSKGSDCNDVGDPDIGDGQGNCNQTRKKAAQALVSWVATDPTGSGDPDFLVVGDMNAYAKEDPITTIKNAGYTSLIESLIGADAYSFVFQGQSGYLDHALASSSLTAQVAGVAEWHNNADEPTVLDYNVEFKTPNHVNTLYSSDPYRTSDHDPVIVGLNLNVAPVANDQSITTAEDTAAPITLTATDADNDPLTYSVVSGPAHGTLSGTAPNLTYTPAPNYNGPDSFTFKANDGTADSNIASVSITVTPVNDTPTIAVTAGGQCLADFSGQVNLAIGDLETALGSLTLNGSSSNTTLVPNGNITFGGSGADRTVTITTAAGQSGSATVTIVVNDGTATATITIGVKAGTSNNDLLTGSSGADMLFGGNGQDILLGGNGNDLLCGGQGNDALTGGSGDDTLDAGSGQDILTGDAGNDALTGGSGDDLLFGGAGNDTMLGGSGNDILTGGAGADVFDGGANIDIAVDFNAGQGDTRTNIP